MDKKWVREERELWDAMFWHPRLTCDTRRGAKLILEAKLKGKKPPKLLSNAEVLAKSWHAYDLWVKH